MLTAHEVRHHFHARATASCHRWSRRGAGARIRLTPRIPHPAPVLPFDPQPHATDLPTRFPSPFDRAAVHPLARRAADEVMAELCGPAFASWALETPGNGKMVGVLVVQASDGTLGYLRAFSGMIGGVWDIAGWAPPTFDQAARDAVWIDGDAEMRALTADRASLEGELSDGDAVLVLRRFDDARSARSRELLRQIQETYHFPNATGAVASLRAIFGTAEPPGGAGDCAAPKLLADAYRRGLRPLALAEFWVGAPPRSGDRRNGSFYPACHGKCGPILAHMLDGLPAEQPPAFGGARIDPAEPTVVYEDAHLVIVDKPSGLLSVPGRGGQRQDCVASRLRMRYPASDGQMVVHRLDLDTSGLLLAAKDATTFSALQRLFSLRQIEKRYVAWVDGIVEGDDGRITLPLRTDINDRPRQIVDVEYGKPADTSWTVLRRESGRTLVALVPHTGRTHQLRVHAAHPDGLDAPIIGDRLYGRTAPEHGARLLLHAEWMAFTHPVTGERIDVRRAAPF
jgi:tRNA pseudouridine32 synthase / 23S rRNA pseudouridine746 synthase